MPDKKIKVPEGMIGRAANVLLNIQPTWMPRVVIAEKMLEAALQWLAENPIVPSEKEFIDVCAATIKNEGLGYGWFRQLDAEWQRRMFLALEPDDSPISDLLEPPKPPFPEGKYRCYDDADVARRVREAYRRGKEGK